jgi:hypothetical protein
MPVSEFVPSGYISIRDAANHLGRELFPVDWTGEEHKARSGLISEEEWLKNKDLPPARGGGAPGSWGTRGGISANPVTAPLPSTGDPSSASYQEEYRARERYSAARDRLRALLEGGDLEAAILDPFTGILHPAPISLWRQFYAARMIDKGEAPIPRSANSGRLLVKQFAEPSVPAKPIPQTRIKDAIGALKEKLAIESLTRPQQADFVRKMFPSYHVTVRQMAKILQAIPGQIGRPKKSNKKV